MTCNTFTTAFCDRETILEIPQTHMRNNCESRTVLVISQGCIEPRVVLPHKSLDVHLVAHKYFNEILSIHSQTKMLQILSQNDTDSIQILAHLFQKVKSVLKISALSIKRMI